jgi:ketosteroid isomerase-like protein
MSRQNAELVRDPLDASLKGDIEPFVAMLAPDVVWDTSRSPFPEAGIYHGIDGVREWFRELGDAFGEQIRYEIKELRDLGDRVLLDWVQRPRAAARASVWIGGSSRCSPSATGRWFGWTGTPTGPRP